MTLHAQTRTAVIAATGCDLSWLADCLRASGWSLRLTGMPDLADVSTESGIDLIVHCHLPQSATPATTAAMSSEAWERIAMAPMRHTLATLRAAPALLDGQGAVVGLGPAFALNGTAGLAAVAAAVEGQRTLVKATARQWLRGAIISNWIAVATEDLLPDLAGLPNLGRYAVGEPIRRRPGAEAVAALIDALAGMAGRALAGQTLIADGGDWMTP